VGWGGADLPRGAAGLVDARSGGASEEAEKTLKSDAAGERRERGREGEDRRGVDGWIDNTGGWGAELMKRKRGAERKGKRNLLGFSVRVY
jgi:hypothetical protein